jgi:hypothetical protein
MPLPTVEENADFAFPLFRESAQVARIVARDGNATLPTMLGAGRLMTTAAAAYTRTNVALRNLENRQDGRPVPPGQPMSPARPAQRPAADIARELDAAARGITPRQGRRRGRHNRGNRQG